VILHFGLKVLKLSTVYKKRNSVIMDFTDKPKRIQDESGRWFTIVSQVEGGYLARDTVTSDLVYMRHCDIACREDGGSGE